MCLPRNGNGNGTGNRNGILPKLEWVTVTETETPTTFPIPGNGNGNEIDRSVLISGNLCFCSGVARVSTFPFPPNAKYFSNMWWRAHAEKRSPQDPSLHQWKSADDLRSECCVVAKSGYSALNCVLRSAQFLARMCIDASRAPAKRTLRLRALRCFVVFNFRSICHCRSAARLRSKSVSSSSGGGTA